LGIGLAKRLLFPNMKGMSLEITEDLIARQTPEAQATICALLNTIRQLQEQLNQSPRNSSLPPSTGHPHAKPPRPKSPATRRPGGQPGHPRQERSLLLSAHCDEVIPLKPAACRRCGRELSGEDPVPLRHQVWELPENKLYPCPGFWQRGGNYVLTGHCP
jgi:transposase